MKTRINVKNMLINPLQTKKIHISIRVKPNILQLRITIEIDLEMTVLIKKKKLCKEKTHLTIRICQLYLRIFTI
jgi:hypothetical protein